MSSAPGPIRILLGVDQPPVRDSLATLLATSDAYDVVGHADRAADAVRAALHHVPDVLLLDFTPPSSALDAVMELGEASTRIRPVLLTENLDRLHTVRALQLGARAVVLRDSAVALLPEAIHAVAGGQYWIGRSTAGDLVTTLKRLGVPSGRAARGPFGLTPRQLEIATAVGSGLTNAEIARKLGMSEDAVKDHVTQILVKTGATTRLELAMLALRHDLQQG
jgi:two-component system, NarL family, nitrate/nitrite response regulator NarL